jgi:hypothetical protein
MKELIAIQSELKAPKNQFNSFGKYKYRNCEDILEALKPLLLKYECTLTMEDEVKEVGGIVFIETTVSIQIDKEGRTEGRAVTAQAGIDINRKGMDVAQSFGSSSSYARKYALSALLLIDDTKDPDSTNDHGGKKEELTPKHPKWNGAMDSLATGKVSMEQIKAVYILTKENEQKLKGYLTL